jgi:hypothetical protein
MLQRALLRVARLRGGVSASGPVGASEGALPLAVARTSLCIPYPQ